MKKSYSNMDFSHDTSIGKATRQMPTPELSYGFDIHLSRRICAQAQRAKRRRRIWSIANSLTGSIALLSLMAMAAKKFFDIIDIEFSLPKIDFSSMQSDSFRMICILSVLLILMLLVDSYFRQRLYISRIKQSLDNKQQKNK